MFSQEQADQMFLDEVGRLHPNGGTVGDLAASKNKQRLFGCAANCPLSSCMKLKLL